MSALISIQTLSPVCAQNAKANGGFYRYKPGELQKPIQRQYPGEIQIIKDTPAVKDFTKPEDPGPTYEIEIPSHKIPQGSGMNVQGGGAGGGGSRVVRLTPNQDGRILAKPGFESNMNSLQSPNKNLAPGITTGVHANLKSDPPKPTDFTSKSGKRQLLNQTQQAPKQTTASTYDPYAKNSASGANNNKSSANVTGVLKGPGRGSIIKQAKQSN